MVGSAKIGLALGMVLTALYVGAVFAALNGEKATTDWSERLSGSFLHILGGVILVGIVFNLTRKEKPE